jgi:hypothetical protein
MEVKPFLHTYLLLRMKEHTKNPMVNVKFIKEQIGRAIVRNTGSGLPHYMIKYVLEDMLKYGLIRRINNRGLYQLLTVQEEKRVKGLMF